MASDPKKNPNYIDVVDGLRAMACIGVVIFHYWQQSWHDLCFTIGSLRVDLSALFIHGYYGVVMLFVISGFGLFYPFALDPNRRFSVGEYFKKRCARILPTYFLCVLIASAYQIGRLDPGTLREQFIGNMTLTQMMTPALAYNQLNGVLWSIAIEVQFYLLFPLLLVPFRKRPWTTTLVCAVGCQIYRYYLAEIDYSNIGFLMNQLPGMLDCFVIGMLAACLIGKLKRTLSDEQQAALAPCFALAFIAGLLLIYFAKDHSQWMRNLNSTQTESMSRTQLHMRLYVSVGTALAILGGALSPKVVHGLFGNRIARFLSSISYQVYLWHMWIALRLKDWHIPAYTTERPMDDVAWRVPYWWTSFLLTLVVATLITYGIEKPVAKLLLKKRTKETRA